MDNVIDLVFHNIHDHGTDIADLWMKEVAARTGGRVRFTKRVGEDRQAIAAADVVRDVPAEGGRYHLLDLIQVPFVFPNAVVGSQVVAQLYAEFAELRQQMADVKVVGLATGALMAVFSGRSWGPVRGMDDFKGARIRSLTPIDGVFETFGASPRHVGFLEITGLIEKGELDATVLGVVPARMFRITERAAPYCTIGEGGSITMHPIRTYFRWSAWERLPEDVRRIIEEIGPAGAGCWTAVQGGRDGDRHLSEALEYVREHGELITVPREELERWRQRVRPLREAAIDAVEARGLPGRKFFERMTRLVAEYS